MLFLKDYRHRMTMQGYAGKAYRFGHGGITLLRCSKPTSPLVGMGDAMLNECGRAALETGILFTLMAFCSVPS